MSVWAVLAAAGRGERFGGERPKAFERLGAYPLLAEPLRRLDESDWIDWIVVAAPPGWEEPCIVLAEELAIGKVAAVVTGGDTRAASVRAALAEIPDDAAVVLVHDAARPLVSDEVIGRVLAPLSEGYDGAVPALPVADTIKRVRDGEVVETIAAGRARRGADAAGVSGRRVASRGRRRGYGLRLARRGSRRPDQGGRRRPEAPEGHLARGSRARLALARGARARFRRRRRTTIDAVAVKAFVFDVGETLVDERRHWEAAADAAGVSHDAMRSALAGRRRARRAPPRGVRRSRRRRAPDVPVEWQPSDLYPDAVHCLARLARGRLRRRRRGQPAAPRPRISCGACFRSI